MVARNITLRQMIDALQKLAESERPETPVVFYDEDTTWLLPVDPDDFIAPNRAPDGRIILRSVGYHDSIGDKRGEAWF